MGRMARINAAIKSAGVAWRGCQICGIVWPFPTGHHLEREYRCAGCCEAELARALRALDAERRRGQALAALTS